MVSVPFPIGKLGVAPAGCMSDVPEMECGRSEIEELIKEVRGGVSGIFQGWADIVSNPQEALRASGSPGR